MINLTNYFYNNYKSGKQPYYDRYINNLDINSYKNYLYELIDDTEVVNRWKNFLYPSSFVEDKELDFVFLILSFYLFNEGYYIIQFPNLLTKIESRFSISDGILKNATRNKYGTDGRNAVTWASRRIFIDDLIIEKQQPELVLEKDLDVIIQKLSPRNAKFCVMTTNEKLQEIKNAFENIGKKGKKYVKIDYEIITNGLITMKNVDQFQSDLQCFRHGENPMIEKRDLYSEESKLFMIDFGILLLNLAYRNINNKTLEYENQ